MISISRRRALMTLGGGIAAAASFAATIAPQYGNPDDMYRALREQPAERVALGSRTINVVFADGAPGLDRRLVLDWVRRSAEAVASYFGRYPVREHGLLIIAQPGERVGHATTYGFDGSATRIHVGTSANQEAFAQDWVLVHEMVHTALPDLPRRALWLQEGNATYVEPIARARVGRLSSKEVWREFVEGMPRGLAPPEDGGIDGTRVWGRLYWGGATFWLLAEIGIYEQSRGRRLLRDALRAMNIESGGNSVDWEPERLMRVGDSAVGTPTLSNLYEQFATSAVAVDLPATFARLGVEDGEGGIALSDAAALAPLRRRILLG